MATQSLGLKMSTPNVMFDIARGNFLGATAVNIFGINREVGVDYETIWDDSGSYVYPSSAVVMSLSSTSADDTMDVLVDGLDADYNILQEVNSYRHFSGKYH